MTWRNKMKLLLAKIARWFVFRASEYTPPEVKYSHQNYLVGNASSAIDKLIDHLDDSPKQL